MKFPYIVPFFLAGLHVSAQVDPTSVARFINTLNGANLTAFAQMIHAASNTTIGQQFIAGISQGNKTVFAPNNDAYASTFDVQNTSHAEYGRRLLYHLVGGSVKPYDVAGAPGHTVERTYLSGPGLSRLEGNRAQALVLTTHANNSQPVLQILDQKTSPNVVFSTTHDNIVIHEITSVLDLPPPFSLVPSIPSCVSAFRQCSMIPALEQASGITIFAPTEEAFSVARQVIGTGGGLGLGNVTMLSIVLGNHVINGTTIYGSELTAGAKHMSASGQSITVQVGDNGTVITSGGSSARIVTSDILLQNGVVHMIDQVLASTELDNGAASEALKGAAAAAASKSGEASAPMPTGVSVMENASTPIFGQYGTTLELFDWILLGAIVHVVTLAVFGSSPFEA